MTDAIVAFALCLIGATAPPAQPVQPAQRQGPVAATSAVRVIANRGAGIESVSLADLSRMYRGEIASLPNGVRIVLAEQVSARRRFYGDVVQMSEDTFRRHWIRVVFAGNPVQAPVPFATTEAIIAFVARTPGAIGFIDGPADETIRVLKVDQKRADDPAYPIH